MPTWTHHRARIAGLRSRGRPADDPQVVEAQRDLAAELLAEHVARVIDTAPALTPEQRDKIATLLWTTRAGVA